MDTIRPVLSALLIAVSLKSSQCGDVDDHSMRPQIADQLATVAPSGADWRSGNQLLDSLTDPSRYERRSRPPPTSHAIRLNASLYISVMGGLNAQINEFTSQLLLRYRWNDPRLAYGDRMAGHLLAEEWAVSKIWIPTICVANDRQSTKVNLPTDNVLISVSPQGDVTYQYRMNLKIYCAMDARKFPFDRQRCQLYLQSWSLATGDLLLGWDTPPVKINTEFRMLEYTLAGVETNSSVAVLDHGNFSRLIVTFNLARESGHYILDYYVPSILLVVLSWVSFWLDPSAVPGRVGLGSSTLLTFITLSRNVSSSLPKVSYVKAMDVYSIVCLTFIFLSLLEFAFVSNIWRRRNHIEIKKLDTRHVLKSTLTPTMTRKNCFLSVEELNGSSGSLSVQSRSSLIRRSCSTGNLNGNQLSVVTIEVPQLSKATPSTSSSDESTKKAMSPQEIAKWIDRRSRIAFPAFFLGANILYWSFIWI